MKGVVAFLLVLCYLASSDAWTCSQGPRLNYAQQIDAGKGLVVARDRYYPYFLVGASWYRLSLLRVKHVSVGGAGLWAVDTSSRVHKYVAGYFKQASGLSMHQVDAGGDDQLVGVTTSLYGYCLRSTVASPYRGVGSLSWTSLGRRLKYYSCSVNKGCWGIDTSNRVYYAQSVNANSCSTSGWRYLGGAMTMIEAGEHGRIFGVTTRGRVCERVGITSSKPYGTSWRDISMCMAIKHVSFDLGKLWAVTTSGLVMTCV
ncbi:fish-egg lectin-like [Clinocottus analis]|uniref:fish-egg lectin-like n=1 Tax=Clinocottus analis TaxID=304258 RepID=UPI0035C23181